MRIEIHEQAAKVLSRESDEIKKDLKDILEKMELGLEVGFPHVRSLAAMKTNLFEIRLRDKRGQFRVIYFIRRKSGIFIIHAFRKKSRKLLDKEKRLITKRLKELE